MSKEKARPTQLASKIGKADFRKVSVTLPKEAYALLVQEAARRKIAGEPDHLLSSIVREAIIAKFQKG